MTQKHIQELGIEEWKQASDKQHIPRNKDVVNSNKVLSYNKIKPGSVVQISPTSNSSSAGWLIIVTEVTKCGVYGVIKLDKGSICNSFHNAQATWDELEYIGEAAWMPQRSKRTRSNVQLPHLNGIVKQHCAVEGTGYVNWDS